MIKEGKGVNKERWGEKGGGKFYFWLIACGQMLFSLWIPVATFTPDTGASSARKTQTRIEHKL